MGKAKAKRQPSFRGHNKSQQGFVELNRHRHYLGRVDGPEGEWPLPTGRCR